LILLLQKNILPNQNFQYGSARILQGGSQIELFSLRRCVKPLTAESRHVSTAFTPWSTRRRAGRGVLASASSSPVSFSSSGGSKPPCSKSSGEEIFVFWRALAGSPARQTVWGGQFSDEWASLSPARPPSNQHAFDHVLSSTPRSRVIRFGPRN
jgi:hypothetical protein